MTELTLSSVLRKTEAGMAAIKAHDRSIPQKARTLLILVDGKKTVEDLSRFSPEPSQITDWLNELIGAGLLLVDVATITPPKAVAAAQAAPTSNAAPVDLKLAIRKASRALEDLLGPSSEPLCLQLEKCKSIQELTEKVHHFRAAVTSMRSEKKADEFIAAALGT